MAFSAAEALAAFGLGQQQAMQRRLFERQERDLERKETTRANISMRVGQGDYQAAQQAAIEGGEFDLAGNLGKLDEGQRKQALTEAQIMGRAAAQLKAIPADQRPAAFLQLQPLLKQAGFSDQELAAADLSDAGLDGYSAYGKSIQEVLDPPKPAEAFTLNPGDLRYGPDGKVIAQSPYDPVVQADGVIYSRQASRPPIATQDGNGGDLEAQAQAAIAAGADPDAVRARLQQLRGGAGRSGPQTFP
jgi:hypothetical protein